MLENPVELIKLKNGSEEVKAAVSTIMISLKALWDQEPVAVIELAEVCRDPDHEIFGGLTGQCRKVLVGAALLHKDGSVHATVRHVVLSAVEGEGIDTQLGDPYQRFCYTIIEGQVDERGRYIPSTVFEGEKGHHPMTGADAATQPWTWGDTLAEAEKVCASKNESMGLSADDVNQIIGTSMSQGV